MKIEVAPVETMQVAYARARQDRWMLGSNGFRAPVEHYQPGASALFGVSEKWFVSDDYWTFNPRFLLANWYLTGGSASNQEAANGNSMTIEAVSVQIGHNGTPVQLKVNGATSSYTLADDAEIWTDAPAVQIAIPPRTLCCVRVAWGIASGTSYVSAPAQGLHALMGDRAEVGTSSLAAKVMAGGISTTTPAGNNVFTYSPIAVAVQGWDGRPVGLIVGTSIEQGQGQVRRFTDHFGEMGPAGRGMVSTSGGAPRLPAAVWAVAGGFAAGISSSGGFTRRKRALDALNGAGTPPMTFILSGFGTNDATATLATWQTAMSNLWSKLKTDFPGVRLVQSTMWPRVSSTDGFITIANQSAQSSNWTYPTGTAWALYHWMRERIAYEIDALLDVVPDICGIDASGTMGKWREDVLPSWSTTLTNSISAGASSMTIGAMPRQGVPLAFSDNAEARLISTWTAGTAYTVTFANAPVNAHTAGATIKEALTDDGTHPGDLISQKVADTAFARGKLAGIFG